MKSIFIGTVEFSKLALERLCSIGQEISLVITRRRSDVNSDFADITDLCRKFNIETLFIEDVGYNDLVKIIKKINPEVIFCFGWSQLIKKDILDLPKVGVIGFHPALLPYNRGRHPIIWALALGLKETGSTFFFMDEGADTGDIISQRIIPIDYLDDARSLYDKISDMALRQIEEFVPKLNNGSYRCYNQDHAVANSWRKRTMVDGQIDWRMSSFSIYNLVRALTKPYVGSHFICCGEVVKVWKVEEIILNNVDNIEPGKVLDVFEDGSFLVKAGVNCIKIVDHEGAININKGQYL